MYRFRVCVQVKVCITVRVCVHVRVCVQVRVCDRYECVTGKSTSTPHKLWSDYFIRSVLLTSAKELCNLLQKCNLLPTHIKN